MLNFWQAVKQIFEKPKLRVRRVRITNFRSRVSDNGGLLETDTVFGTVEKFITRELHHDQVSFWRIRWDDRPNELTDEIHQSKFVWTNGYWTLVEK